MCPGLALSTVRTQSDEFLACSLDRTGVSLAHNDSISWLTQVKYRIFEQVMTNLPSDGSEDLQLVLAACKCLDLLVTLQTEEFQM